VEDAGLVYIIIDCQGKEPFVTFIGKRLVKQKVKGTRKDRRRARNHNRLMHMLNGNIDPLKYIARWMRSLFGLATSYETAFDLNEEEKIFVTAKVQKKVEPVLVPLADNVIPSHVTSLRDCIIASKGRLVPCPGTHGCLLHVFEFKGATSRTTFQYRGMELDLANFIACCYPFICSSTAEWVVATCETAGAKSTGHCFPLPELIGKNDLPALDIPYAPRCDVGEPRNDGSDSLGPVLAQGTMYRPDRNNRGHRCAICFPTNFHFWSDWALDKRGDGHQPKQNQSAFFLRTFGLMRKAWVRLGSPKEVVVVAASEGYEFPVEWSAPLVPVIVITDDVHGPSPSSSWESVKIVVATIGGGVSLANYRALAAYALPVGTVLYVEQTRQSWFRLRHASEYVDSVLPQSGNTFGTAVAFGQARLVAGYCTFLDHVSLPWIYKRFSFYCLDEVLISFQPFIRNETGELDSGLAAIGTNAYDGPPSYFVTRNGNVYYHPVTTRGSMAAQQAICRAEKAAKSYSTNVPVADVIDCGVMTDPTLVFSKVASIHRENKDYLPIVILTFGTEGDTRPLRAITKYLARSRLLVVTIRICTSEEGSALLAAAEDGLDVTSLGVWNRAQACVTLLRQYLTLAPSMFLGQTLAFTFEFPLRYASPASYAIGAVGNVFLRMIQKERPMFRIAAFEEWDCVPRGTDDEFDVFTPGGARPIRAIYAPGSTRQRFSPPAVVVKPGNHIEQFRRAQIVYAVGLGTITTAAAAGCRVVALSCAVDRNVRYPDNAGKGMKFGVSPERILAWLCFADIDASQLLYSKLSLSGKFHYYRLVFAHNLESYLFFMALVVTAPAWLPRRVVIGPGLIPTLVLSALGLRRTPVTYVTAWIIPRILVEVLERYGLERFTFIFKVIRKVARNMSSLTTWLLVGFGMHWALAAFICEYINAIVSDFIGYARALASPGDNYAYLEADLFFYGSLPMVHTRLVSHDSSEMLEGRFAGQVGHGVPYRVLRLPYSAPQDRFRVRFPTLVSFEELALREQLGARYSVFWNCQTTILMMVSDNVYLLGAGLLLLGPILALSFIFSAGVVVFALIFYVIGVVILLPLNALPFDKHNSGMFMTTRGVVLAISTFFRDDATMAARCMTAIVVVTTGWSDGPAIAKAMEKTIVAAEEGMEFAAFREELFPFLEGCGLGKLANALEPAFAAFHRLFFQEEVTIETKTLGALYAEKRASLLKDFESITHDCWVRLESGEQPGDDFEDSDVLFHALVMRLIEEAPREFACIELEEVLDNFKFMPGIWAYGSEAAREELMGYYQALVMVPNDDVEELLRWLTPLWEADAETFVDSSGILSTTELDGATSLACQLIMAGAEEEDAIAAVAQELAAYHHVGNSESASSVDRAVDLFEAYASARAQLAEPATRLSHWVFLVRRWCMQNSFVPFAPLEFVLRLAAKTTAESVKAIAFVAGPLVAQLDDNFEDLPVRTALAFAIASFLDLIDLTHRISPKPAWALLLGAPKFKMSRGDAMFASFVMTSYKRAASYEEWADRMKDHMRGVSEDVDRLLSRPPTRALFFPRRTYGLKASLELIDNFDVDIMETQRERDRLERAIKAGAGRGIDGAWTATPETVNLSLSRYLVNRPRPSVLGLAKIKEAADSIFDDFPEMYDQPRGLTVRNVIAATEWKYSAGLPFLPIVKKRATLRNSGWIHAIRVGVGRMLDSGNFPGVAFHCFPKNQIVAVDKIAADRKAIRTVTAGDRLTAIAYNTLAGERNKRLPPARALILPAFARTEGGMSDVYAALRTHPDFYTGDATKFDSTVTSELVIQGPTRLWERGIAGNWGERATTTFMNAYYSGVSDGILVSLLDGTVIRKTGGGGTGSAATSPDNRDWVRIALRATWSIITGLPCSDFIKHVTLANASDDIAFSCDEMTSQLLPKWKAALLSEYGVVFSFERHSTFDGILHLRVVQDPDFAMYEMAGTSPGEVVVMHDPKRLYMMQSEYRADRMNRTGLNHYQAIMMSSMGTLLLTAHNPEAYSDMAEQWVEAAEGFLLNFFNEVEVTRATDQCGRLAGISINPNSRAPGKGILKAAGRLNPRDQDKYVADRQSAALKWMRTVKPATYLEVFRMWTQKREYGKGIKKRYLKLPTVPAPAIDVIRSFTQVTLNGFNMVPKSLLKMSIESDTLLASGVFTHSDYLVEKFVYWRYCEVNSTPPSAAQLAAVLRQSPFLAVTDVYGFMQLVAGRAEDARAIALADEAERDHVATRLLIALVVYTVSDVLIRRMANIRIFGTFMMLCFAWLVGVDVLYSSLSLCWWLACGCASLAISNMSYRDPYVALKMFSIVLASSIPAGRLVRIPYVFKGLRLLRYPVRWILAVYQVRVFAATQQVDLIIKGTRTMSETPLTGFARRISTETNRLYGSLIVAPMGSGKSTSHLVAHITSGRFRRVFLLLLTNYAVENYENVFIREELVIKIFSKTGVPQLPDEGIIVLTVGLFSALYRNHSRPAFDNVDPLGLSMDLVVIDEIGVGLTEQAIALAALKEWDDISVLCMTGTPVNTLVSRLPGQVFNFNIAAKATREVRHYDVPVWDQIQVIKRDRDLGADRLLVVTPAIKDVDKLAESMTRAGWPTTGVHGGQRDTPMQGDVVGTTIVDLGVNIIPEPTVLVDSGLTRVSIPSSVSMKDAFGRWTPVLGRVNARWQPFHHVTVWTDAALCAQRHARVGRTRNGIVYAPKEAGTGNFSEAPINIPLLLALPRDMFDQVVPLLGLSEPFPIEQINNEDGLPGWVSWARDVTETDVTPTLFLYTLVLWLTVMGQGSVTTALTLLTSGWEDDLNVSLVCLQYNVPRLPAPAAHELHRRHLGRIRVRSSGGGILQPGMLVAESQGRVVLLL